MADEAGPSRHWREDPDDPDAGRGGDAGASEPSTTPAVDDSALKEFFSELREVDRDNEVNRILWAFKLNPYERLNLRFDATPEDIRRAYRKISLMVHPDKCKHPQAKEAFEAIQIAQKELLDEELTEGLRKVLDIAREEVRKERAKEAKKDTAVELAALLHEKGRAGVEEEYEKTDAFHERWRLKARDLLAKSEWRRRRLNKRMHEEENRLDKEAKEAKEKATAEREHHKSWEKTRDTRVNTWRDFVAKKKGGAVKSVGMVKPPKIKTHDEDKLYVQRPVGEQFRGPPAKLHKKERDF